MHPQSRPSPETPKLIARALLELRLPFFDPQLSFPGNSSELFPSNAAVIGRYSVETLLADREYLPSVLAAVSHSLRKGERKLDTLRDALFQLARTGRADRQALKAAEKKLPIWIRQLAADEEKAKMGVNPHKAGDAATVNRALEEFIEKFCNYTPITGNELFWDKTLTPATPNEIDAEQVIALGQYQDFRLARQALEVILNAVQRINAILDREPPLAPII